jgi:hypothetical protein
VTDLDRYWTAKRVLAAQLVAEDEFSDTDIAKKVGRSRKWLAEQKNDPIFLERVTTIVRETAAALQGAGVRDRDWRLQQLQADWDRTQLIVNGRGKRLELIAVYPEYASGFLAHDAKSVRVGRVYKTFTAGVNGMRALDEDGLDADIGGETEEVAEYELVHLFKTDGELMKARREILKQAAIEQGEWLEKAGGNDAAKLLAAAQFNINLTFGKTDESDE